MPHIIELSSFAEHILNSCFPVSSHTFSIHSVYKKAVNLLIGDQILTLLPEHSPLSALGLMTDLPEAELSSLTPEQIRLLLGTFCTAQVRDLSLPHTKDDDQIRLLCEQIRPVLTSRLTGGFNDILILKNSDLNLVQLCAASHIRAAASLLSGHNFDASVTELGALIGLGIGLTPSGDDFLCGVLAGCALAGIFESDFCRRLRSHILSHLERTNDISGSFLSCAASHQFSSAVSLLGGERCPSSVEIDSAFSAVGHSSGFDTLYGIYFILSLSSVCHIS